MGGLSNSSVTVDSSGAALHIDITEATIVAELTKEAKRKKKTLSQLVGNILAEHLEELEDYRLVQEARKKDKGKPSIPWSEVKRKYGLEG